MPKKEDPIPEGRRPEEFLDDAHLVEYYAQFPDKHPHAQGATGTTVAVEADDSMGTEDK